MANEFSSQYGTRSDPFTLSNYYGNSQLGKSQLSGYQGAGDVLQGQQGVSGAQSAATAYGTMGASVAVDAAGAIASANEIVKDAKNREAIRKAEAQANQGLWGGTTAYQLQNQQKQNAFNDALKLGLTRNFFVKPEGGMKGFESTLGPVFADPTRPMQMSDINAINPYTGASQLSLKMPSKTNVAISEFSKSF